MACVKVGKESLKLEYTIDLVYRYMYIHMLAFSYSETHLSCYSLISGKQKLVSRHSSHSHAEIESIKTKTSIY